jgi:elongation factor P
MSREDGVDARAPAINVQAWADRSGSRSARERNLDDTMQTVLPSELKRGMALLLDGTPQLVEDLHTTGTAQTKHKLHARLRNLKTGRIADRIFAEAERLPVAELAQRRVQFSYQQADRYVFLDAETFDELVLTAEQVGDRQGFLKENEEYRALFLEGRLLDIVLPPSLPLKIQETAPPIRGGSDSAWKPATLETGLEIMVPLFLAPGEVVRVDTQTRKYLGKDHSQ